VIGLVLSLAGLSFFTSLVLCVLVRRWSVRAGAIDTAPIAGQVKMPPRRIPNTGGIGLFWAVAGPVLAGLFAASVAGDGSGLIGHAAGAADRAPPRPALADRRDARPARVRAGCCMFSG
jgi:UDP-N-acetylmuramyl pentapeptide phosphotransferase/UDP-N-acetylglucosamine-1-phosphate transferase